MQFSTVDLLAATFLLCQATHALAPFRCDGTQPAAYCGIHTGDSRRILVPARGTTPGLFTCQYVQVESLDPQFTTCCMPITNGAKMSLTFQEYKSRCQSPSDKK
ncbi:hypothetical protein Pst134EB_030828 [Puccinia striiformis f. sp. tritici]|nr:hypothetical protein Pst134EB_030828 [Puccinia striiformis f. sp. tritici]